MSNPWLLLTLVGLIVIALGVAEVRGRRSARPPAATPRPWLSQPRIRRRVVAVAALILLIGAWATAVSAEPDSPVQTFVQDTIEAVGVWGPVLFMLALAGMMIFAPLPNGPMPAIGGLIWGFQLGTLYALLGQFLGATVAFTIGKRFGRRYLPRLIGDRGARRVDDLSRSIGLQMVFWARVMPFIPSDFSAYAAGMTVIRYPGFIAVFMFGSIVPTMLGAWFGASLTESWAARLLSSGALVAATIVICVYWLARNRTVLDALLRHLPQVRFSGRRG